MTLRKAIAFRRLESVLDHYREPKVPRSGRKAKAFNMSLFCGGLPLLGRFQGRSFGAVKLHGPA
jgi:hypothetical protein